MIYGIFFIICPPYFFTLIATCFRNFWQTVGDIKTHGKEYYYHSKKVKEETSRKSGTPLNGGNYVGIAALEKSARAIIDNGCHNCFAMQLFRLSIGQT